MGNAAGQGSDGFHFLGLGQLVFKDHFARDIPLDTYKIVNTSRPVSNRRDGGILLIQGSIFSFIGHSTLPDPAFGNGPPHIFVKGPIMFPAFEDSRVLADDLFP